MEDYKLIFNFIIIKYFSKLIYFRNRNYFPSIYLLQLIYIFNLLLINQHISFEQLLEHNGVVSSTFILLLFIEDLNSSYFIKIVSNLLVSLFFFDSNGNSNILCSLTKCLQQSPTNMILLQFLIISFSTLLFSSLKF